MAWFERRGRQRGGLRAGALALSLWALHAAVAARELTVVQIGTFGDQPLPAVVQIGEGMQALIAATNARGGVHGDTLSLLQLDDGGSTDRFVARFEEATGQRKAAAVLLPYGSPTVQRMLDEKLLDRADTVVINAVPGAESFRKPGHARLFHVRAGDGQQIDRIVQHVSTLGMTRLGVLYVDAPGGHSGLRAAEEAVQRYSNVTLREFKATLDPASIAQAARTLAEGRMEGTVIIGPPRFLTDSVLALRSAGYGQSIFSLSYLQPQELVQAAGPKSRGVGISQAYPNPMGISMPLQREFHAAMKARFPALQQYTVFQLEGYVTAKVFVEAAKRAKQPTPAEIARTLRSMGEVDLGGFRVNYSQGNHGSRFVDIGVMSEAGHLLY